MNEHPLVTLIRGKLPDSTRPFSIIADLEAHPGRGDEVARAAAGTQAIRLTRLEPGCVAYDMYRDAGAPDHFVMYECWRNLDALTAHLATAHFAAAGTALSGLLVKTPVFRVLTSIGENT